jgi:hypothetical protein
LRNRAEGRPGDSIGAFHRQLTTLERTGPESPMARVSRAARMPRLSTSRLASPRAAAAASTAVAARRPARPSTARSRAQKRRRDVMLVLAGVMVSTLALSFVPGLGLLLVLHVVSDLLFVAYVVLLIRLRGLAAEREMKLRFLPSAGRPEPALALRRSAN